MIFITVLYRIFPSVHLVHNRDQHYHFVLDIIVASKMADPHSHVREFNVDTIFGKHKDDLLRASVDSFRPVDDDYFTEDGSATLWTSDLGRKTTELQELPIVSSVQPYVHSSRETHQWDMQAEACSIFNFFTEVGKSSKHLYQPPCNHRDLDYGNWPLL